MLKKYFYLFLIELCFQFVKINSSFDIQYHKKPNFLNNNSKIRNNFSMKENLLFYGLLLGPTLNKYWGKKLSLENFKDEYKTIWDIKDIIKNTISGNDKFDNLKKIFNNTLIRAALVWLLLPRAFHYTEMLYKHEANALNKETAKNIFLHKKKRFHKQQELDTIINANHTTLSSILTQLKEKNPNIEYRFNKTIKNMNDDNHKISKIEVYKNIIKIKKELKLYENTLNYNQLKNRIDALDIDDALKDIDFIIKNRALIDSLPDIKLIKKENSFLTEPLEDSLLPIQSKILDKEHIERDSDLTLQNSWKEYQQHIEQKIKPIYPYPYSKYVNENKGYPAFFDNVNFITQLD